ncbi:peptidase M28 [Scytonema hofmannii PCC 7110]|uniref:Peptidase M28 n=1 Tax=Scytonema hofmannii PCC 7110 TaxID=128403 RepID=A0A139WVP4_9CYAN|nr:M28 family peptidase [Scytonema hofmannii]KYC36491.1 peptidase M28 [Scytonema hofmannii PCC 7110]
MKAKKKWFWLVLLALTTMVVVLVAKGLFPQHQESVIYSIRVENSVPVKKDASNKNTGTPGVISSSPHQSLQEKVEEKVDGDRTTSTPQVSGSRLFSHLQKLNFIRHTPVERSRARSYISSELQKLGWQPQLEEFTEKQLDITRVGINIFAERPGTSKDAGAILVAAHYDTVFFSPGADDNASGVAVVLELARLLGSRPTAKTLQLAFFDLEEAGLLGSKAFVKNKTHLENLNGVIVMDMVGYACHISGCQKYPSGLPVKTTSNKGDFVAVVGDAEHLPILNAFQKANISQTALNKEDQKAKGEITSSPILPSVLTLPVPLKGLLTPDVLRSDHAPFWYQGIGAVLVTDTANLRTPHYHKPTDVPATLDREFFTGTAQLVVNAATELLEGS